MVGKVLCKRIEGIRVELLIEAKRKEVNLLDSRIIIDGFSELDKFNENDDVVFSSNGDYIEKLV